MASTDNQLPRKLWEHTDPESTNMGRFRRRLEQEKGIKFPASTDIHIICIWPAIKYIYHKYLEPC
jgi:hypothetical protein